MGEIITFYSYKGGIGRTMALANIAVLLAQWGYNTLMVDWDLEAPGLEYFFYDDVEVVAQQEGIIDLLNSAAEKASGSVLSWKKLLVQIALPNSEVPLHFLTAGKRDNEYFSRVRNLDLQTFYTEAEGGYFIEQLRDEWKEMYDYVLVDSRTGITDIGGVCTIQLPDILVLLSTPTEQGLKGMIDVYNKANQGRQKLPFDRLKLLSIPILSRFDLNAEFETSQEWLRRFSTEFLPPISADWLPTTIDHREFSEKTKIPYIPYFSFGEKLPVLQHGTNDPAGLGYAYETLAALIANKLNAVEQLMGNRDEYAKSAFIPKFVPIAISGEHLSEQNLEFNPDLFVGRETELVQLISWVTSEVVPRRLKTIVAPPGYGKSWLLRQLADRLSDQHGRDLFLIWVPTKKLKSREDIAQWLLEVSKDVQCYSLRVRNHDLAILPVEAIISRLLEDLCVNCNSALRPVLIVDAFDELLDNERRELEKHLLERFWYNPSVRIIMAFRDELRLTSPPLRRGEERTHLGAFTPTLGQEQLQRRAEFYQDSLSPQELPPLVPSYNWTHPYINTRLYEILKQKKLANQSLRLAREDLRRSWLSLIEGKLQQKFLSPGLIEKDLQAITAKVDAWTLETFAQVCGYNLSTAFNHLQDLMALSLITGERGKYRVVDGIREIIQATAVMEKK